MTGYIKIFVYLIVGEGVVFVTQVPIPGPVIGLICMLADFWSRNGLDGDVERVFDGVSSHLPVLFVPAGAGILASAGLMKSGVVSIAIAVLAGTLATILATGLAMRTFLPPSSSDDTTHAGPEAAAQRRQI